MGDEYVSEAREPLLELRSVTFRYDRAPAVLRDFSLRVNRGELLCVLGPSGCGKTSLLKVAGSFLPPDEGEVYLAGRRVTHPDPDRVMVFQEPDQLFPWKRVVDNVAFAITVGAGVRVRPHEAGRARVLQALEEVGLADSARQYPYQLSGGMRQRVALARALVGRPELLLMDEPFGSVDAPQRRELQQLLQRLLADHHGTAVFVTHDVEEALLLGTRTLVMGRGGSIALSEEVADDISVETRERDVAARRARLLAVLDGKESDDHGSSRR
jgi:NitT/TauT family transport system ATP-binding protein